MRKYLLLMLILPVFWLTGCDSGEPENFSFPLAYGIEAEDDGAYHMYFAWPDLDDPDASADALSKDAFGDETADNLADGIRQMSMSSNRNVNMNHLKVLILDRGMMDGESCGEDLIAFFRENREISWNAYVLLTDGEMDHLFSEEVQTGTCMGLYLENILEGWSNIKSGSLVTVGDLVSQYYNETECLLIPVVSISENVPVVESFAVVDHLTDAGEAALEEVFSSSDSLVIYKNE